MTPAPKASATLIRAQCAADPVSIARAIVAAKIEAMVQAGALRVDHENYTNALAHAATLDRVRIVEAQASRVAWPDPPRMKSGRGPVPPDFAAQWLMGNRLDAKGKRGARHPVNALLNAAFAVTAGRLTAYLEAAGFAPAIGFLHQDKKGRFSLAYDAIEPLRPMIERGVFHMIEQERFEVGDFVRQPDGSVRLAPGLLSAVLNIAAPSHAALAAAVRWIERLVLAPAGEGISDNPEDCLGQFDRLRLSVGGGLLKRGDPALLFVRSRGETFRQICDGKSWGSRSGL